MAKKISKKTKKTTKAKKIAPNQMKKISGGVFLVDLLETRGRQNE